MTSVNKQLKARFLSGAPVSQFTALRDFGCARLSPVVSALRNEGLQIATAMHRCSGTGRNYAVYQIPSHHTSSETP